MAASGGREEQTQHLFPLFLSIVCAQDKFASFLSAGIAIVFTTSTTPTTPAASLSPRHAGFACEAAAPHGTGAADARATWQRRQSSYIRADDRTPQPNIGKTSRPHTQLSQRRRRARAVPAVPHSNLPTRAGQALREGKEAAPLTACMAPAKDAARCRPQATVVRGHHSTRSAQHGAAPRRSAGQHRATSCAAYSTLIQSWACWGVCVAVYPCMVQCVFGRDLMRSSLRRTYVGGDGGASAGPPRMR